MSPPFPTVADPVANWIAPEAPELVVPVEKDKCPLTPVVPASTVLTTTEPLDEVVPAPVDSDI